MRLSIPARGRRRSGKPILAVDVDGVVLLLGEEDPGCSSLVRSELIEGMMHRVSLSSGMALRRLAEEFDLVWATGWEGRANQHFPRLLGIPELPHLRFDGAARFGSAHWKMPALEAWSRDRPLAWIDDNHDDACHAWARRRETPTLLVTVRPNRGLETEQVEILLAWARALKRGS